MYPARTGWPPPRLPLRHLSRSPSPYCWSALASWGWRSGGEGKRTELTSHRQSRKEVREMTNKIYQVLLTVLVVGAMGVWFPVTPAEASTCDLTTAGSSCSINGAQYF